MTQAAINYGRVLYELSVQEEAVKETDAVFEQTPELLEALKNPLIPAGKKQRILERIFGDEKAPKALYHFLLVLLRHNRVGSIGDIFAAYHAYAQKEQEVLGAELHYVTAPLEEQVIQIKEMLCKKYRKRDVELIMIEDTALIGGFLIRVGDVELDWSMRGRLKQLEQVLMRR